MADHILVVDDEESLRTVLGTLLRRQGYDVTVVEDDGRFRVWAAR